MIKAWELVFCLVGTFAGLAGLIVVSNEAHLTDNQSALVFGLVLITFLPAYLVMGRMLLKSQLDSRRR
jgi:uncharacterized membrane protein (GlpM family)